MSTPIKFLVYLISFILILVVGLAVLIQTQVTPERLRTHLLPAAEEALQSRIEFGDVEIGLLSGVTISDLDIKSHASEKSFITVKKLKLKYRLWSLLRGKVDINQLLLEQPKLELIRFPDGRLNINDLLSTADSHSDLKESQKGTGSDVPNISLRLVVGEVRISDGELFFADQCQNERTPYRYHFKHLNLEARKITLDDFFPVDLSVSLGEKQIDVSGQYRIADKSGELLIHSEPINLVQFSPYYRETLPLKLGSALIALNLEVNVQAEQLASRGRLDISQLDLSLPQSPELQFKDASLSADYALTYDFKSRALDLSTLLLELNGLQLGLEGKISFASQDPTIKANVVLDELDLRQAMQVFPGAATLKLKKYSPAGMISGQASLNGRLSEGSGLLDKAQINLQDVQISTSNIRTGVSGGFSLKDGALVANGLLLNYGGMQGQLDLKAENILTPRLKAQFLFTADSLDMNSFGTSSPQSDSKVTELAGHESLALNRKVQGRGSQEIGPFSIAADVSGRIEIGQLIYKKLVCSELAGDVVLRNNILYVNDLIGVLGKGALKASGLVDLGVRGLAYRGEIAVEQPDVGFLFTGLLPEKQESVSGLMSTRNRFSGQGVHPTDLLDRLTLEGSFSISQGEIRGSELIEAIASFLGSSDFKILSFETLTGEYVLQDGVVDLLGALNSSKIALSPAGTIGRNGDMALAMETRVSPEILRQLGVNRSLKGILVDKDGWGVLPLKISGSLNAPKIAFDTDALTKQALKQTKEKAAGRLLDKLSADDDKEREPLRNLLDNTLNRLFNQ